MKEEKDNGTVHTIPAGDVDDLIFHAEAGWLTSDR